MCLNKMTCFNDSESTLLGDDNFIHGALSDLTLCGVFSLMFNVKVP